MSCMESGGNGGGGEVRVPCRDCAPVDVLMHQITGQKLGDFSNLCDLYVARKGLCLIETRDSAHMTLLTSFCNSSV